MHDNTHVRTHLVTQRIMRLTSRPSVPPRHDHGSDVDLGNRAETLQMGAAVNVSCRGPASRPKQNPLRRVVLGVGDLQLGSRARPAKLPVTTEG